MATVIEKSGRNIEEAFQAALNELGATADNVDMEVLESPSKGFLGIIGVKPAKVRVTLKEKILSTDEIKPVENFEVVEEEKTAESLENNDVVENDSVAEENPAVEAENFNRDEIVDTAKKFFAEVLTAMNVEAEITVFQDDSDEVIFDISGKNLGVLIGKHGQTLDALQYILNLSANKFDSPQKLHFILDVENYRKRRTESLQNLAKGVAQQVIRTRKDIKLEPMNRHERRVIHTALQNNEKVDTRSVGEEPYRYIIVSPRKRGR